MRSLIDLMGHDLTVPYYTTLPRRCRTIEVGIHAPGRKAPVDLVLGSTGLKLCRSVKSRMKSVGRGGSSTSPWTRALVKSCRLS
ncbi:transposase [Roseobacter sp. A03A-229]